MDIYRLITTVPLAYDPVVAGGCDGLRHTYRAIMYAACSGGTGQNLTRNASLEKFNGWRKK